MFDRLRLCAALFVFAIWSGIAALAQAPVGSLTGVAHDTTGAIMPGINVTVTNKDTGLQRKMTTSAEGIYSAASLPAGNYTVAADATGFRSLELSAIVRAGQVTTVDLTMEVGAEAEVINVQGESNQLAYDSHDISGIITRENIQNLPLNGRSFLQLSMLEPGVNVSPNNVGQYNKQFDVSILGASTANNSVRITVDGATVQDSITGGTQQNFSQEVVEEFQLSSTNFDLSTGIGAGGSINVVTRSGGNDFHGSAFFFYRDHNMSAYPTLAHEPGEPSSPYFARQQEGYWFGGPILKDKLFFFSSLEHIKQTALFSAFPSDPLFQFLGTNTESPYNANELTERLDWRINAKNNAFLRYSHDGNNSFAPTGIGDLPSDWSTNTNWADSGVFSLISVITPATANEFRYSYTFWSNNNAPPTLSQCPAPCLGWDYASNSDGPMITILGVNDFAMGEGATTPQSRLLRRHTFADNVTSQKGTHSIKFGGYWEYQKGTGSYAYAQPAAVYLWSPELVQAYNQKIAAEGYTSPTEQISVPTSFNSVADVLKLPVAEFTIGVGNPIQPPLFDRDQAAHDNMFHFYGEDAWKITPRFTLNYGLAWSYESNALNYDLSKPSYLAPVFGAGALGYPQHSPHDFSPMLGFAWQATKDAKTVVRGGSAIYYDTWDIFNRLIERVILGPEGTGRIPLPDSSFFSVISGLNGFGNLPAGIQPTSLNVQPTTFTGAEFEKLLPLFVEGAEQELGNPNNTSLAVRNVDLFKTGQGLIPQNFKLPYSEHFSIGVQREVRSDLLVSADFVFRQYIHQLIENADLNHYNSAAGPVIPKCGPGQALEIGVECSTGPIEADISGARSHYKGLLLKATKRFSHRTTGTLAYAYASEMGYNGLIDNSNWMASWGPQAGHQTLTGSLVVALPFGIQLSGISSFQSATPFQPFLTGVDLNGNGVFAAAGETLYPGPPLPGGGFNQFGVSEGKQDLVNLVNQFNLSYAGKTDPLGHPIPYITLPSNFAFPRSFNSQDLRVTKIFRLHGERVLLSVFGECFNVFNIANLTFYNDVLNAPNFGEATQRTPNIFGTGGPRAFQLGSRITF
ncbi:MAG TPA: carboxypeptidase regulatory-like domain-containing protein [Bryobacteraceae bacterium]|nr:carboxypeptidase regulatory-like domain-containing protein [Bryobacteraceae bacterium]